ncbi:hypothetical protein Gbth_038_001 [Gluconobacter thailandicus F149-1 = NBRC 100600]|uniref:Uncharacterized protein n=1 Tax=Gluconobacter thailandicus NBRC 3257 TaxID=1381097 RepID=A0ABQ0IWW2_GLUTH|nr:hypothetical protein [Gluconobacter thailandicus]KXV54890.1 hypothetical protein AD946_01020 [Gluconobacter thailandicus]GAC89377.1 hypothetical protein NBRC3255_3038 [Gluconobacter thailandicus NBRC 3255]GAD26694.1 hypothetical protein NBRC3257_1693 [Gluconobacter thailandicus NBRC 3257]GAN93853.1 hypothetical protein Gbth_038_001 [Gluconobacter thailandicus F149-1 = NBRC 100600]GBR60075.1 hypothetical protein AA100600_1697 [Gluconobacter thailandicus F149-1 = NBRC 100600]
MNYKELFKKKEMTEEQQIEKSFFIMSSSLMRNLGEEINKPHPTIKAKDLDMDKIRHDIFNTTNDVSNELKRFKQQRKELESHIHQQQAKRQQEWQQMGKGGQYPVDPQIAEQMEKLSAHIAECARFIVGTILNKMGLADDPGPYRRSLTADEMYELEIQHSQNELMQIVTADGNVRDQMEKIIVQCNENRKNKIQEWENRPEAVRAQERLDKFQSIMSSDMSESFKKKVFGMHSGDVMKMLDKVEVSPDGKIISKKHTSLEM